MTESPRGGQPYGQGQQPYGEDTPRQVPYGQAPYGQPPDNPQGHPPLRAGRMTPGEEKGWALGAHLSAIVAQFLGPLLIFLIQGPKSPFVRAHAAEALNFNLSVTIYFLVSYALMFVLVGFPMMLALMVMWFVCTIIATVKAGNGEGYRYPLTIRFVT